MSHVDLSALFSTMNYQRHLSGWIVFEFLIIIVGKSSIPSSAARFLLLTCVSVWFGNRA